jgi:glycosyltransferase involved in cell wall biosynthesis
MVTISALIPTYNRAHFLDEAIGSVLRQTRRPDEIIVVDDGSTDDTEGVLARYDGAVRYIRQENAGPSAARNRGIQAASCDFIALLDSDDLWVEDRLERQEALLALHPDLDVIFGPEGKFATGGERGPWEMNDPLVYARLNPAGGPIPDAFEMLLGENFCISCCTVLFRKDCVAKTGLMDPGLRLAEDYDLWLRFALNGFRFAFINSILSVRRMHEGNLVNDKLAVKTSVTKVLSRYRGHSAAHDARLEAKLSDLHYDLGSALLRRGDWAGACYHLNEALPIHPKRLRCRLKIAAAHLCGSLRGTGISGSTFPKASGS